MKKIIIIFVIGIAILIIVLKSNETEVPESNKTEISNETKIGAFYYPWYDENKWKVGYNGNPDLGLYDSRDQDVISNHVQQLESANIDFILVSWWGPGSQTDITLKEHILQNQEIKYAIVFEPYNGAFKTISETDFHIDFSDEENKQALFDSMDYLAGTYFSDDRYQKINDKPIIYFWVAFNYLSFEDTFGELRKRLKSKGFDAYMIGDIQKTEIETDDFRSYMKHFDAVSSYNMFSSIKGANSNLIERADYEYARWKKAANDSGADFIPVVFPGYDDRIVRRGNEVLDRSPERFREMLKVAEKYKENMILITSFNEWHENTQIEADREEGRIYLDILNEK
ncbi:glycoside hydrolase family 99-like domain-containing protein [Patescibacteria group bacterium]